MNAVILGMSLTEQVDQKAAQSAVARTSIERLKTVDVLDVGNL